MSTDTTAARADNPLPQPGQPLVATLVDGIRRAGRVERGCYLLAVALMVSGLVHLGVLVVSGGSWSGPLSWRKPATFGLSFGLTLATVTWVLSFSAIRPRPRAVTLSVLAGACLVEVVVITVQAWRGLTSHFGVSGPGAGLVAAGAAAGAAVLVVDLAVITVLVWRAPAGSASMRLALRAGFAALMVALGLGVYMLARGMAIARTMDPAAAFAFSATVKPGHAATLHGVLVLPALAWLLTFAQRPERFRLAAVRTATAGYLLLAVVVVAEAIGGIDPLALSAAPLAATVAGGIGVLLLLAAIMVTLLAVARTPASVGGR